MPATPTPAVADASNPGTSPAAPASAPLPPGLGWLQGVPPALWPFIAIAMLALGGGTATGFSMLSREQITEIVRTEIKASEERQAVALKDASTRQETQLRDTETRLAQKVESMKEGLTLAIREAILDERERNGRTRGASSPVTASP